MGRSAIKEYDWAQVNECSKDPSQNQSKLKAGVSDRLHLSSWREPDTIYCDFSRFTFRPRKLEKARVRFDTDFILKVRSKLYINAEFFLDDIRTVFLPKLSGGRALEEFADEDPVLLMDNCPSHVTDEVLEFLRDARFRVITRAPHTWQIFQQFDVSLLEF
jgi:hypothetical protein